jgi:hypothetical protein
MAHAEIREYVMAHAERGACKCGRCFDAPPNPEQHQPLPFGYRAYDGRPAIASHILRDGFNKEKELKFLDVV